MSGLWHLFILSTCLFPLPKLNVKKEWCHFQGPSNLEGWEVSGVQPKQLKITLCFPCLLFSMGPFLLKASTNSLFDFCFSFVLAYLLFSLPFFTKNTYLTLGYVEYEACSWFMSLCIMHYEPLDAGGTLYVQGFSGGTELDLLLV